MHSPPNGNFSNSDLPILKKVTDAYKVWYNTLPRMPRLTRYSLGEKINGLFIELSEQIFVAGFTTKDQKLPVVKKASFKLDLIKFFMQIAWELKAIETKDFSNISPPLIEIGKMLGGWQKQLIKETPSPERRS